MKTNKDMEGTLKINRSEFKHVCIILCIHVIEYVCLNQIQCS